MNSLSFLLEQTPVELDENLTDDTTYAIQNKSTVPVFLIVKDAMPDITTDADAANVLYPAGDAGSRDVGFIKPKDGFSIYGWSAGKANLVITEAV